MKIYLMTDMEGCAGILNHDDWVLPSGRYYDAGRRILTDETNAAIDGFFAEGATEIVVVDGHGAGGIDPLRLDSRAQLQRGYRGEPVYPFGLDRCRRRNARRRRRFPWRLRRKSRRWRRWFRR